MTHLHHLCVFRKVTQGPSIDWEPRYLDSNVRWLTGCLSVGFLFDCGLKVIIELHVLCVFPPLKW